MSYTRDNWPQDRWPNFGFGELVCKESGINRMHTDTMDRLQRVRSAYGRGMTISSGYRDVTHPIEAAKIAKEQGDDAPEVLGLTMWALAFLLDQCTHLHIAGDETNERAADGNVMQRGHHNGIFPLAALAAGGGVVMGEKIPLWCENIPDHGFDTLGARVILNKAFIGPVFVWQTLHAFGAFGGERFGGGEKTPAPAPSCWRAFLKD